MTLRSAILIIKLRSTHLIIIDGLVTNLIIGNYSQNGELFLDKAKKAIWNVEINQTVLVIIFTYYRDGQNIKNQLNIIQCNGRVKR